MTDKELGIKMERERIRKIIEALSSLSGWIVTNEQMDLELITKEMLLDLIDEKAALVER